MNDGLRVGWDRKDIKGRGDRNRLRDTMCIEDVYCYSCTIYFLFIIQRDSRKTGVFPGFPPVTVIYTAPTMQPQGKITLFP